MRRFFILCVSSMLFAGTAATALGGASSNGEVIVRVDGDVIVGTGSPGDANWSNDRTQYIGCSVYTWEQSQNLGSLLACYARDKNGTTVQCYSWEPTLVEAGRAFRALTHIRFDGERGTCGTITTNMASRYL